MDSVYNEDSIVQMDPGEHVRRRPEMYYGKCFEEKTLDSLPFEVLCHAFDEYFDGNCNKIKLLVGNDSFEVRYNAGILLEGEFGNCIAEDIMTQIKTCRNVKKHLTVGGEFCHLGMAIINFGTERSTLSTVCNGKRGQFVFEQGKTVSRLIESAVGEAESTEIFMKPDPSIFEDLRPTFDGILEKTQDLRVRLPGLEIEVIDARQGE
jgi:DNA gyrase/topoisomerase IV subunit B